MQYLFDIKLIIFFLYSINTHVNCQFLRNQVKPNRVFSQSKNLQYLKEYLLDRRNGDDEKYIINYKQRYGIRYNPITTIRRHFNSDNNTNKNDINQEINRTSSIHLNINNNVTKSPVTTTTNNVIDIEEPTDIDEPTQNDDDENVTAVTTTNIMKPSRIKITLELLVARLKQLLRLGVASFKSAFNETIPHTPHHSLTIPNRLNGGEQRFLNLFNIVQFSNSPCHTWNFNHQSLHGVCYHKYECENLGGIVGDDKCANGFGVCCLFLVNCNGSSKQNITYWQNPGFPKPSTERLICVLTVELLPNVKQIHIDFVQFELNPPTIGTCINDQFIVSGQNINNIVPVICGINTGQHMYIQVDNAPDQKLFISILTQSFDSRIFNLRITQLTDDLAAPENCLQYYQDVTGNLETFNYSDEAEFAELIQPSYFNNLNYVICVKRVSGHCNIIYTNEWEDEKYEFQLLNVDQDGVSVLPPGQAGAEIYDCADDFISINGIRLCGEKLNDASITNDFTCNAAVRDISNGPIILPVRTNEAVVGRGFRLHYEQIECEL